MVRPERFELPTTKFVAWYSIQLSYGRTLKTLDPVEIAVKRFRRAEKRNYSDIEGVRQHFFETFFLATVTVGVIGRLNGCRTGI
jgi:hypothetical protein